MDLTVIVHFPLPFGEINKLDNETNHLLNHFKTVVKVDYDLGGLKEVLAEENLYEWGFWLRHMCTCLYGEDLSQCFEQMKPNEKISSALNKDLLPLISSYRKELLTEKVSKSKKRSMLKRLIRGVYLTINVKDESWSTSIDENLMIIQQYFPKEVLFRKVAPMLHTEDEISNQTLLTVLEDFLDWFIKS
ncbi:nucleotidyltransferase domain-containing protein [Bacillus sp. 2205SS5-2]|uniref:nucleotidyltransferase domain-containing protein n=1 Tax=Bacillus sp. 2205SS5-2 TaxID=3109031 RepID=UPI0030058022